MQAIGTGSERIPRASPFPSSVGVNPQESIVALALRNTERLGRG
jgi:choline dehydrogenase-like flavoprotein